MSLTLESIAKPSPEILKHAWYSLLAEKPQTRIREAAAHLGVSEAELLATGCGSQVIRLDGHWPDLLADMHSLGSVMALTRNDYAVHEKHGCYSTLAEVDHHLLVSGAHIDLCLLLEHWAFGFAVTETTTHGPRHSLQFFGYDGLALHKIYLTADSNIDAWRQLTGQFQSHEQSPEIGIEHNADSAHCRLPPTLPAAWQPDVTAWQTATDTGASARLTAQGFRDLMQHLAEASHPISLLVANPGALQLHRGPIHTLRITGPWFNVLDAGFNLHLNETAIARHDISDYTVDTTQRQAVVLRDHGGRTVMTLCDYSDDASHDSPFWQSLLATMAERVP
ncbi:MAG: hypothetical protein KGZ80_12440 [Methylomonas sp.]|nr:hypothetical protein [Methylomonas sp.]PPD21692.1 MAG: hypothetical protein CTY23_04825 [Methylomonas sp.]PPD25757.1 MAG: hypothetical protein CTY22_07440 [Methylomonas sp.]PPD37004.1 MAG: hypothetical protein CTY21_07440 [Methylomonas sp.]PPD40676.1 MAG: hypothetical protein CTY17_05710 [Methylomonas sp.]